MTHEFKKIVKAYETAHLKGQKAVLATVVALEGSSYRRPGVRMLILDNDQMIGAVSGGCVEKEVLRQARSVFENGIPKVMSYDGRYRLGCEGILYILLEPFQPSAGFIDTFQELVRHREAFELMSYYRPEVAVTGEFGSFMRLNQDVYPLREGLTKPGNTEIFNETMEPCFRLMILGAEHDAVQLCSFAALNGWEVEVVATPTEEKSLADFPGAQELISSIPEELDVSRLDSQTAVVLMSHSYVKDLKYLLALKDSQPAYLGLLGPATRREKLLNEFLEHCPGASVEFLESIYGPSGLNIGAETPQEIAIAVLAEILSVVREQEPMRLRNKKGAIHS